MIMASEDNVVFWTAESDGQDLCIMDSIGRFTLIHEDQIDDVISMMKRMKRRETHSIFSVDPKDYVDDD